MGPPAGAQVPPGTCTPATSEPKHSSRDDNLASSQHASKRRGQHEEYHNSSTKRRKSSARRAAKIQEKATQLVHQVAAPHGATLPLETNGTLAKAEDRQDTYNLSIQDKPWATSNEHARRSRNPTAGLSTQTGRCADEQSSDDQSDSNCLGSSNTQDSLEHSDMSGQQTNSDPSHCSHSLQADSADTDSGDDSKQAIKECKEFSSTQSVKHNLHDDSDMAAVRDRQRHEQTNQHHQQNDPEEEKSLPPVIQKLQKAQQRAHDEMEASEKKSSEYRFPAEAEERFVSNARKHKAELDVSVYEHGRRVRAHAVKK